MGGLRLVGEGEGIGESHVGIKDKLRTKTMLKS